MREYFKDQIESNRKITKEALEKVEFKRVWSDKFISEGDTVVYSLIYEPNTDDLKFITFLERELDELANNFIVVSDSSNDYGLPILAFKNDPKKRI